MIQAKGFFFSTRGYLQSLEDYVWSSFTESYQDFTRKRNKRRISSRRNEIDPHYFPIILSLDFLSGRFRKQIDFSPASKSPLMSSKNLKSLGVTLLFNKWGYKFPKWVITEKFTLFCSFFRYFILKFEIFLLSLKFFHFQSKFVD